MNQLTEIQAKVLAFIMEEIREHSLPPTHREISDAFKWRSHVAAKCHLLALEKKGFIRTRTRISRGIELKPTAWEWQRARGEAA